MIAKTTTGVKFFDEQFGGVYSGRAALATGRSGTGKTILSLQFLAAGLERTERCLLLSARPADDVALYANAFGIPVGEAIDSGNLVILEYSDFVPGRDREDRLRLPPDSFMQLKQIIEGQAIQRVALDTVLPWVTLDNMDQLPEHIFSFVRAFHRINTTTLFTIPKPVSTPAHKLRRLIEDVVPISISMVNDEKGSNNYWLVNKYLGMNAVNDRTEYRIMPKQGIVSAGEASARQKQPASPQTMQSSIPGAPPRVTPPAQSEPTRKEGSGKKPSFSDLIMLDNAQASYASTANVSAPLRSSHPDTGVSGWSSVHTAPPSPFKDVL